MDQQALSQNQTQIAPRARLLAAATDLFSEQGFTATTVRAICTQADVGGNMVHHYFGNKQGLYDEILRGFTDTVWMVPVRIIAEPARNRENLIARLEIFIAETLEALIEHRQVFEMVVRERMVFGVFESYSQKLVAFLESGKTDGYIRQELDSAMLTGLILDRLGNQILFANWIEETSGSNVINDQAYKKRWLAANSDLVFHGSLA